jgi:hypothetical protein
MQKRIISQILKRDYMETTYADGTMENLSYPIDENGEEYVELFPNAELDDWEDQHKN